MTLVVMSLNCHTYLLFSFFVAHNLKHIVVITSGRVKCNSELGGLKGSRCLKKKLGFDGFTRGQALQSGFLK